MVKSFDEMNVGEIVLWVMGFFCYIISGLLFVYWVIDKSILIGSLTLFMLGLSWMYLARLEPNKKPKESTIDRTGI